MPKILRVTTVPISLNILLKGQLAFMQKAGYEVVAVSADGEEVKEIVEREGVRHEVVPFTRKITPVQDLKCLIRMIRLIKKEKPDIVHTHTPKAGLIGMMAAWYCGVPQRLHTVAGMPLMQATGLSKIILNQTEQLTYNCATHILPNSHGLKDWIKAHFTKLDSKLHIVGKGSSNGINTTHYDVSEEIVKQAIQIKTEVGIQENDIVFCFVGRLVRDKGIAELIEAFTKMNSINIHLFLVGEYEDIREPLSEDIKTEIKTNSKIHHVGFQKDIRPYLTASDIFVFPSYREGFPNVVLQACCFNLPCIVTDINGSNEIIQNGINGWVIPLKSTEAIYDAMSEAIDKEALRHQYAFEARKSVLQYDQKNFWQQLLDYYRNL